MFGGVWSDDAHHYRHERTEERAVELDSDRRIQVAPLGEDRGDEVAALMSRAFQDDPLFVHACPDPGERCPTTPGSFRPYPDGWPQSRMHAGSPVRSEPNQRTTALMLPAIASILAVDDDRDLCDLVDALLTGEGYRVHCVYDGEAAWAAVQAGVTSG